MKWPARKMLPLLGVLAVVIGIALIPTGEQGESAAAVKSSPQALQTVSSQATNRQQQSVPEHIELERLSQQKTKTENGKAVVNAFSPTSWYVARHVPPSPTVLPPSEPTAPPLPFTYVGRYEDPPKLLVILAVGNRLYTVSEGEVIDSNYRVEHISDSTVDLVYLPLNINQSISTVGVPDNSQYRSGAEERYRRP